MKIINVSDKPYEFSFDSAVYGPFMPGEIVDLPYPIATHAIKRSQIIDELGNTIGFNIQSLDEAKADPGYLRDRLVYECPFVLSDQCQAKPFKTVDELRAHLESHWKAVEPVQGDIFEPIPAKASKK